MITKKKCTDSRSIVVSSFTLFSLFAQGHTKGTYPVLHVPMDEDAGLDLGAGILVTGSADCTARSWSVDSGLCLKVGLRPKMNMRSVSISKKIYI